MNDYGTVVEFTDGTETWSITCPSSTLSTTNHTWAGLRLNCGLHDERLMTNCLSMTQLSTHLTALHTSKHI